jgi:hypothetical protein
VDSTQQLSTIERRLRPADIGCTVEEQRHETAAESAGKRQGTGTITDTVPAQNPLPGIHFRLSPNQPSRAVSALVGGLIGMVAFSQSQSRLP